LVMPFGSSAMAILAPRLACPPLERGPSRTRTMADSPTYLKSPAEHREHAIIAKKNKLLD
jgi:hypothetical protein